MSNALTPSFGCLIENGWASDLNPHRRGYFVRKCQRQSVPCWELTDGNGTFWYPIADKAAKLTIIGNSPFLPLAG